LVISGDFLETITFMSSSYNVLYYTVFTVNPEEPKTTALVKDLITLVVTSQIGLIGSALGFYFGSRNNDSK